MRRDSHHYCVSLRLKLGSRCFRSGHLLSARSEASREQASHDRQRSSLFFGTHFGLHGLAIKICCHHIGEYNALNRCYLRLAAMK
jgi:hypothetical protein